MDKSQNMRLKLRTIGYIALVVLAALFLVAVIGAGAVYRHLSKDIPHPKSLRQRIPMQSTLIYDRTGETVLYELSGEQRRKILSHEEVPDIMRNATIAIEDADFYRHNGVDLSSIVRALIANLRSQSRKEGASTITQQLAKNAFLTSDKTWKRKAQEVLLAVRMERELSKDEILDLYLNYIPYGSNVYGVQSASEFFFNKDARDLTLDEAAMLAALPKATAYYSPYGKHTDALAKRQRYVLSRMKELGYIDRRTFDTAASQDTLAKVVDPKTGIMAPHFVFYVIDQLEKQLGRETMRQGGLKVITSLDLEMQEEAERIVREGAVKNLSAYQAENAALVALDPKSGRVLAMVGSRDYYEKKIDGEVNVTLRPRQPGSAFKPIVYAKAFEKGYQPETLLYDVPINFGPDGSGKDYIPQNYSGNFRGLVSMRQALAMSLNVPAVETLYLAGIDDSVRFARQLGISTLRDPNKYGLALVLGGAEVTPLDMAAAYSVFANDGLKPVTSGISEIRDASGKVIYTHTGGKGRVVEAEVARKINSILSDNDARTPVFGKDNSLYFPDRQVAAKTGTTQDYHDAWTVGYTPSLVVAVWAGNNDNRPMKQGADGVYVAAPIWNRFMQFALGRFPQEPFTAYAPVESDKLMLTGKMEMTTEYYNKKTGKKLDEDDLRKTKKKKIEERRIPNGHTILYYVDKNDPLGSGEPNYFDPMLHRWERSVSWKPPEERKE